MPESDVEESRVVSSPLALLIRQVPTCWQLANGLDGIVDRLDSLVVGEVSRPPGGMGVMSAPSAEGPVQTTFRRWPGSERCRDGLGSPYCCRALRRRMRSRSIRPIRRE